MSVFKFPSNFYEEIRSLVCQFWWGQKQGRRKIPRIAWKKLCEPKCNGGLGFRDFQNFNWALLGKQAWRLMTNRECLWSKLMSSKYYPNTTFLEANIGNNPSYVWRGIWESKWVVLKGARKRIGDGWSTRVWFDPWIPDTQTHMIISPRGNANEGLVIEELMQTNGLGWDKHKIRAMFLPFEQQRILDIPISISHPTDIWCWDLEKDGCYSIRSAYKAIMQISDEASTSKNDHQNGIWNKIWRLPTLPRIKVFLWQLCNDALPVKSSLATRMANMDTSCGICGARCETILHMVRDCRVAEDVWEKIEIETCNEITFRRALQWMENMWENMEEREACVFAVTCWAIWESRNRVVFENELPDSKRIQRRIQIILTEIDAVNVKDDNGGRDTDVKLVWEPPPEDTVKINVDARVMEDVGVGVGMVCRNESGNVEWGITVQLYEHWDPRVVEASAKMVGVREVLQAGHRRVIVESDCQELIKELTSRNNGRSNFHLVIEDIFYLCSSFESVNWSFVCRKLNILAHELARVQPWVVGRRVWNYLLPPKVDEAVNLDLLSTKI